MANATEFCDGRSSRWTRQGCCQIIELAGTGCPMRADVSILASCWREESGSGNQTPGPEGMTTPIE